jgi:hypothetical protein
MLFWNSLCMWDCLCEAWIYVSHCILIKSANLGRFDSVDMWACDVSSLLAWWFIEFCVIVWVSSACNFGVQWSGNCDVNKVLYSQGNTWGEG